MAHRTLTWVLIFIGSSLALLLPLSIVSWLNYSASRENARQEITGTTLPLVRDNIYSEIHSDLLEPINVATTMANDSFLKTWAENGENSLEEIQNYLYQIHKKYDYFTVFFVSEKNANYYHFSGLHKVISSKTPHDMWYYNFIETGKEYELNVDTNEAANNQLTVFLNFRVESSGKKLLGATGVGMKMDTVARLLQSTGNKFGRHVFLVDRKGEVQAHTDVSMIHKNNITKMSGINDISKDILATFDNETDLSYSGSDGAVYVTSRYMPDLDWFLIVEQNENEALQNARQNFFRTLIFGVIIWILLLIGLCISVRRYHKKLKEMARVDELTGLGNRRQFEEDFTQAMARFNRNHEPLSLILLDIDGFKAVNDKVGHLAGDKLLVGIAKAIKKSIRSIDRPARWGGDEFTILSNCDLRYAEELANRVRQAVKDVAMEQSKLEDDPRRKVSASCGVVICTEGSTIEDLLHEADQLMYRCKENGGNCVKRN